MNIGETIPRYLIVSVIQRTNIFLKTVKLPNNFAADTITFHTSSFREVIL